MRDPQTAIFVGLGHFVVALDAGTGAELWRATVKNMGGVTVLWDGEALVVASAGEVYRLDPRTGATLWHNPMSGLGIGVVTLASERLPNGSGTGAGTPHAAGRAGSAGA